jgi:hypothetical protein
MMRFVPHHILRLFLKHDAVRSSPASYGYFLNCRMPVNEVNRIDNLERRMPVNEVNRINDS